MPTAHEMKRSFDASVGSTAGFNVSPCFPGDSAGEPRIPRGGSAFAPVSGSSAASVPREALLPDVAMDQHVLPYVLPSAASGPRGVVPPAPAQTSREK
jgi:hypothetical protein